MLGIVKSFGALLITLLLFTSCNEQDKQSVLMPGITGKMGEVILVMPDGAWEKESGDTIRGILQQEYPSLPQLEPMFNLVRIPPKAFTKIFMTHRNVFYIDISKEYIETKILKKKDVWARPQTVIEIQAENQSKLFEILCKKKNWIVNVFHQAEQDRLIRNYRKYEETGLRQRLEEVHGISLSLPKGYALVKDSADFVWFTHETPDLTQGIFIYSYDYKDSLTFTKDYLVSKRNEFLKSHVPGPSQNSYMTTEELFPVEFTESLLNEQYMANLSGLWKVENDFMGGPFISYNFLDGEKNRIICVEGFVYAPKFDKRIYVRQLEAILQTFKLK